MLDLAIFALVTEAWQEANPKTLEDFELQWVLCIHYLAQFCEFSIKAFINLASEVNIMQSSFTRKLVVCICKTNVGTQKIDGNRLENFGMVITLF